MSRVSVEASDLAMGAERRRSHRAEVIVRVDYSTVDEIFQEFTCDINEGGMFIETEAPRALGTEVLLRFSLPGTEKIIETIGTVVRVTDGSDGAPRGMGIEFEDLQDEARAYIDQLIRSLRSSSRPVEPVRQERDPS
jgi:uncharacterized protein (TIGR02266 family)